MRDPYFQSKFPSKIVRKKKPIPYRKFTGGYACHRCHKINDAAYLVPSGVTPGFNSMICDDCIKHYL